MLKLYPILDWDDKTTYQYLPKHDLPYHPLEGMDYDSVGDWHSTRKISEVEKLKTLGMVVMVVNAACT